MGKMSGSPDAAAIASSHSDGDIGSNASAASNADDSTDRSPGVQKAWTPGVDEREPHARRDP